jgi:energy-coupling factor transporter transmembrane protein EcfT
MQTSPYYDMVFLAIVVLFIYFINVEIMKERCGAYSSVIAPTLMPWLLMFLPFMVALYLFPEWKTPFSNTIGYLVVYLTGGVSAIEKVLVNKDKLTLIYQSPALLINQFKYATFEVDAAEKYKDVFDLTNQDAVNEFKQILLLKEVISTWVWYMLISSITVSTSYMMMMSSECTKTVDDYLMAYAKSV